MKIYRVVITGAKTNAADRIVRLFADRQKATDFANARMDALYPNSASLTITALRVRDDS